MRRVDESDPWVDQGVEPGVDPGVEAYASWRPAPDATPCASTPDRMDALAGAEAVGIEHAAEDGGDHAVATPMMTPPSSSRAGAERDSDLDADANAVGGIPHPPPSYGDQFGRACWRQESMARRELEKERRIWRWAGTG